MHPETKMLYKLILLYFLEHIGFAPTNIQLIGFLLDRDHLDYINAQLTLTELIDDGCIYTEQLSDNTYYHITSEGRAILSTLHGKMPSGFPKDIDSYIAENDYKFRNEVSVKSNYISESGSDYTVHLSLTEGDSPVLELKISVPSAYLAKKVCSNWKKKSSELYSYTMKCLLDGENGVNS